MTELPAPTTSGSLLSLAASAAAPSSAMRASLSTSTTTHGARRAEASSKKSYLRGAIVLLASWGAVSAIWIAKVVLLRVPIPYFLSVLFLGYSGGLYAAWNAMSPVTGVEAATIVRRRAGSPLPRRANRS